MYTRLIRDDCEAASPKVYLITLAARVRPKPLRKGKAPPNFTIPPVSVSQIWPPMARDSWRVRQLSWRLASAEACRPPILRLNLARRPPVLLEFFILFCLRPDFFLS